MELVVYGKHKTVSAHGDDYHKAQVIIGEIHYAVHNGKLFGVGVKTAAGSNIADDGSFDFLMRVGSGELHFVGEVVAGGDAESFLYEDATVTDGTAWGTVITPSNRKRGSEDTLKTLFYANPSVSDVGDMIGARYLAGGSGPKAGGGVVRSGAEWELKPNTVYLVRAYNRSGGAVPMQILGSCYEE